MSAPRSYTRAIDVLDRAADPALLARIERHERVELAPLRQELPQSWREVPIYCDPARFYAGYLGVRDELEIPYELTKDLKERVPQALLRDLHRMEYPVDEVADWEQRELPLDPGGRKGLAEAREALVREPLPVIEPLVEAVMAEQLRRRRFLHEPWQPTIPDDFPRNYREILE